MSQERRRRQQEQLKHEQPLPAKKLVMVALLVAAVVAEGLVVKHKHDHRYDVFAKCLAAKKVTMYGLFWCEHCAEQKKMFGASFEYVPYVECGIKGQRGEQKACSDAGVKLFPTWRFDGERHEGTLPLEALSDKTGCPLL